MRGFLLGLVVAAIIGAALPLVVAPAMLNRKEALPLEERLGNLAKGWGVPGEVRGRTNPLAGDAAALAEGRRLYSISCAACHGPTGDGRGTVGRNLFPPPANLTSPEAKAWTDGEIYWFISNGISFVGMPSYGITTPTANAQYNEQQIWQLVAQVRALQAGGGTAPAGGAPAPAASPAAGPSPVATPGS